MGNNWARNPREIKDLLSPIITRSLKESLELVLSITLHTLGPQSSQNYPFGLIEDFLGYFTKGIFIYLLRPIMPKSLKKTLEYILRHKLSAQFGPRKYWEKTSKCWFWDKKLLTFLKSATFRCLLNPNFMQNIRNIMNKCGKISATGKWMQQ